MDIIIPDKIFKREPTSFAKWLLIGYIQAGIISNDMITNIDDNYDFLNEKDKYFQSWVKWTNNNTDFSEDDCLKYWNDLLFNREKVWLKLIKIL